MTLSAIVLISFFYIIVHIAECRRHHGTNELADSHIRIPSTVPPPRWKFTGTPSSIPDVERYGYNPAGYGPLPLNYYTNGRPNFPQPSYSTKDTGRSALGYFLKNSLKIIISPTYYYYNTNYDPYGYIPKYDHYTIHHYDHNRESIQRDAIIHPDTIVVCVEGSSVFCPPNTTSFCTNNGALLCVANMSSTVSCMYETNESQAKCIRSSVPCKDNDSPECQQLGKENMEISIPCVSTAKSYGSASYTRGSLVISNNPKAYNPLQNLCVTILALPAERKPSEGEKVLNEAEKVLSSFATKILGL